MPHYCRLCQINEVENPGDICELCALTAGVPSHASSSDASQQTVSSGTPARRKVLIPGKNTANGGKDAIQTRPANPVSSAPASVQSQNPVPGIYNATTAASAANTVSSAANANVTNTHNQNMNADAITAGITKNIISDVDTRGFFSQWWDSLIYGWPYPKVQQMLIFQVYPDFSGSALNAQGNACDQVVVYGTFMNGSVNENNDVEIYGRRDMDNRIICDYLINKASGVVIRPKGVVGAGVVRTVTVIVVILIVAAIVMIKVWF